MGLIERRDLIEAIDAERRYRKDLERERDALLAVRREWEREHARLTEQLRGGVEALKLIACARAHDGQHAIDVGLARNALEAMGVDPSLWRGQ